MLSTDNFVSLSLKLPICYFYKVQIACHIPDYNCPFDSFVKWANCCNFVALLKIIQYEIKIL